MIEPDFLARLSEELGVEFIDARIQIYYSELIVYDNGVLRDLAVNSMQGVGIRVVHDGSIGYSSTFKLDKESIREAAISAYKLAKATSRHSHRIELASRPTTRDRVESKFIVDPETIDHAEKIRLLVDIYKTATETPGIASATMRFGYERDHRIYISSTGDTVETVRRMIGVSARLVSHIEGSYESLYDSESEVAGWEFIKRYDWNEWVKERAKLVVDTARAQRVKPGKYDIILDNDMVGLMLHEAFGHASEGDIVVSGGSVLGGRIGESVASELVTIVDDGFIEGGMWMPYDDEGTPKRKTYTVKNGVLVGFLNSLATARKLEQEPTGNARVMSYRNTILVRQTNTYMEPGDWKVDEMIRDTRNGIYVRGRGALGGQVNPLTGAFTFTSGPSYLVENGEITRLVKGVMLTGLILETLRNVDAVGRDLIVRTSVFGGCGKDGQTVRVGDGGPHVRVRGFTIGGG